MHKKWDQGSGLPTWALGQECCLVLPEWDTQGRPSQAGNPNERSWLPRNSLIPPLEMQRKLWPFIEEFPGGEEGRVWIENIMTDRDYNGRRPTFNRFKCKSADFPKMRLMLLLASEPQLRYDLSWKRLQRNTGKQVPWGERSIHLAPGQQSVDCVCECLLVPHAQNWSPTLLPSQFICQRRELAPGGQKAAN